MKGISKPVFFAWLFFLIFIPSACSPGGPSLSPQEYHTPAIQLVNWERSGGIAGVCQRFMISGDQTYRIEDCTNEEILEKGQLTEEDWSQLKSWQQKYQAFEWNSQLPSGSADMLNDSYTFSGSGELLPSPAEQEEINRFLTELLIRLGIGS